MSVYASNTAQRVKHIDLHGRVTAKWYIFTFQLHLHSLIHSLTLQCDNCVDGCDHHCQWVNNCIGSRNYSTFFALLMSAVRTKRVYSPFLSHDPFFQTTTLILIIVTSALHLYFFTIDEQLSFRETLSSPDCIVVAVAFILSVCVIWPVAALLSYHMRVSFPPYHIFQFPF